MLLFNSLSSVEKKDLFGITTIFILVENIYISKKNAPYNIVLRKNDYPLIIRSMFHLSLKYFKIGKICQIFKYQ